MLEVTVYISRLAASFESPSPPPSPPPDGRETGSASRGYSVNVARPFVYWPVGSKPITLRSRLHKPIPECESRVEMFTRCDAAPLHRRLSRDNATRRIMRASVNGEQSADRTYTSVKELTECFLNKTPVPLYNLDPAATGTYRLPLMKKRGRFCDRRLKCSPGFSDSIQLHSPFPGTTCLSATRRINSYLTTLSDSALPFYPLGYSCYNSMCLLRQ